MFNFNVHGISEDYYCVETNDLISLADLALRIKYDSVARISLLVHSNELILCYCPQLCKDNQNQLITHSIELDEDYFAQYFLNIDKFFFLKKQVHTIEKNNPNILKNNPPFNIPSERIITKENLELASKEIIKKLYILKQPIYNDLLGAVFAVYKPRFITIFYLIWFKLLQLFPQQFSYKIETLDGYSPEIFFPEEIIEEENLEDMMITNNYHVDNSTTNNNYITNLEKVYDKDTIIEKEEPDDYSIKLKTAKEFVDKYPPTTNKDIIEMIYFLGKHFKLKQLDIGKIVRPDPTIGDGAQKTWVSREKDKYQGNYTENKFYLIYHKNN